MKKMVIGGLVLAGIIGGLIALENATGFASNAFETFQEKDDNDHWGIQADASNEELLTQVTFFDNLEEKGCEYLYTSIGDWNQIEALAQLGTMSEMTEIPIGYKFVSNPETEESVYENLAYILYVRELLGSEDLHLPLVIETEGKQPEMLELLIQRMREVELEVVVYTASENYDQLKASLPSDQQFWLKDVSLLANSGSKPKDIPEDNLPKFWQDPQVVMWSYTTDNQIKAERQVSSQLMGSLTQHETTRCIAKEEFLNQYVD